MDSLIGAARAHMEEKYNGLIFITGFACNAVLAGLLTFVGDKLGIPLYYAAIFVFGGRLFNNLAVIRRLVIEKILSKKTKYSVFLSEFIWQYHYKYGIMILITDGRKIFDVAI